jgi:hypothetical protein
VDTTGIVGQYTSLVVDSGDRPHVSYYDATRGDLKYAIKGGLGWGFGPIDQVGVVGKFSSISLDDTLSRIAYYDATNGDLKLALQRFEVTINGDHLSTWDTFQLVDTKGDVGQYASLVLQQGAPRIAYWDKSREDARYASWNGIKYDVEVASSGGNVGQFASLALDRGDPRISYYDVLRGDLGTRRRRASGSRSRRTPCIGLFLAEARCQRRSHIAIVIPPTATHAVRPVDVHDTVVDCRRCRPYASLALTPGEAASLLGRHQHH